MPRGKINHRDRARQINSFENLRYGTITPTDIDGLIEYHNQAYVLLETKYKEAKTLYGQKLALERLTRDLNQTGKPTICIIAEHEVEDPKRDVDVANAIVRKYKCNNRPWCEKAQGTVKQLIDNFLDNYIPKPKLHDILRPSGVISSE